MRKKKTIYYRPKSMDIIINKVCKSMVYALCSIVILISCSKLFAATPGETSLSFLKIPIGARPTSLAAAYTGLGNDAFALFYNPASIGITKNNEVTAMHLEYFESIRYENIASSFIIKEYYVVGIGIGYLYTAGIPKTIPAENIEGFQTIGEFGATDLLFVLCNSIKISKISSIGLNLKYIRESIDDNATSTFAVDIGYNSRISILKNFTMGIAILNLGLPLKYIEKKEILPLIFRAGVGWKLGSLLVLGVDIEKPFDNQISIHSGGELQIFNRFFIRAGYQFNFNKNNTNNIALGGGIKFKKVKIDYAFVPYKFLGGTHRFSAGILF